jgi:hypothetical protein
VQKELRYCRFRVVVIVLRASGEDVDDNDDVCEEWRHVCALLGYYLVNGEGVKLDT